MDIAFARNSLCADSFLPVELKICSYAYTHECLQILIYDYVPLIRSHFVLPIFHSCILLAQAPLHS